MLTSNDFEINIVKHVSNGLLRKRFSRNLGIKILNLVVKVLLTSAERLRVLKIALWYSGL